MSNQTGDRVSAALVPLRELVRLLSVGRNPKDKEINAGMLGGIDLIAIHLENQMRIAESLEGIAKMLANPPALAFARPLDTDQPQEIV